MPTEVTVKDKDGREVTVKCDNEPVERCREQAEKAYKELIAHEPKSPARVINN